MRRPLSIRDYVRTTSRAYTLSMAGDRPHATADCEVTEYFKKPVAQTLDDARTTNNQDNKLTVSAELYAN